MGSREWRQSDVMFHRFWPTKWVYENRRHWCSFKATINWLIWNDVDLVGLENCYLGFSKFWKFWGKKNKKMSTFFSFQDSFPPHQNFQKTVTYVRGQCLMNMCTKFQVDIFKNGWDITWNVSKTGTFHVISRLYPDFPNFVFLPILTLQKVFKGHFSRSLQKSDLKTCIAALNHDFFLFDLFRLVTWDDLDLYYGLKAQEMILTDVRDTIHADSLTLFALNIEILLADVTKTEKSKILTLTWHVTSSVTSGSNFWPCTGSSPTGLSNGVWNLEIGPVVWEISGGNPLVPPPQQDVLLTRPQRGEG